MIKKTTIKRVKKYCSELGGILDHLEYDIINLVVAATGSGKTKWAIEDFPRDKKIGILAPFTSLTEQIYEKNSDLKLKVGEKAENVIDMSNGIIASYHSAAKLLDMEKIDLLVLDEIHYLINYSGFAYGMLNKFWEVVEKLKKKHLDMKIVALTGTPQFIRKAEFLDFNLIVIKQDEPTAKPEQILVSRSWTKEYSKNNNYICLYPSRKLGRTWAAKHKGVFLSSQVKESSKAYADIVQGKMPSNRIFTSTILSTGVSITEPVDTIYTNWLPLVDIAQMAARPRLGGHVLKVTQIPKPFFMDRDTPEPELIFTNDFESNMKLLNDYSQWYSLQAHQNENDLFSILYQMIWLPEQELPEL